MDKVQKACSHKKLRLMNTFEIHCFDCGLEWSRVTQLELFKQEVSEDATQIT
jgi:hypothetical protein